MAAIFATLISSQGHIHLPLTLQEPKLRAIDIATCPNVIEDARYDLDLTIDFNELEPLLAASNAEETELTDAEPLSQGARLAQYDLGLIGPDEDELTRNYARTLFTPADQPKSIKRLTLKINDQDKGELSLLPPSRRNLVQAKFVPDARRNHPQIFLTQYDTVTLGITVELSDGTEFTLYGESFLLCASRNQSDNRNISQILMELTSIEDDTILDLMFAHAADKENLQSNFFGAHRSYKSLSSYVELVAQVLSCYQSHYHYFRTMAKHMLVKADIVTSFDKVRMLTHKSQMWLTQNLHVLAQVVPEQAALTYLGQSYLPMQLQSTTNVKSFDTYENRVVVGFLQMVVHNVSKTAQEYKNFLDDNEHSLQALRAKLKEQGTNYEAPIITVKSLQYQKCQQELEQLKQHLTELSELYRHYAQLFKFKHVLLHQLPRQAKAFQELKPYAQIFHTIHRWFRYGEFSLQKDKLFLQSKTLDKLFEYYCLYRLLDMLLTAGFTPIHGEASFTFDYARNEPFLQAPWGAQRSSYAVSGRYADQSRYTEPARYADPVGLRADRRPAAAYGCGYHQGQSLSPMRPTGSMGSICVRNNYSYEDPIANTYVLTRGKQKVTVYYQPVISTTSFYNKIFAFRTNCKTQRGRNNPDNFYCPDFILKFSSGDSIPGDDDYIVLDAKFSRSDNVIDLYLEDLIKKYSTNMTIAVLRRTQVVKDGHAADDELAPQTNAEEVFPGYQLVGTKSPCMIMALNGRVTRAQHSSGASGASPTPRYRAYDYHDSPLARLLRPATTIGVLELSAQTQEATKFLWDKITRTLPYLQQGAIPSAPHNVEPDALPAVAASASA